MHSRIRIQLQRNIVAIRPDQADVLRFAAKLESGAVSAFLGAVPVFDNRDLSRAAAGILGDEAMH
jgi:hypothetical protein